eukprot:scaffold7944_cov131-Isochrysis_galbana.AAC.8
MRKAHATPVAARPLLGESGILSAVEQALIAQRVVRLRSIVYMLSSMTSLLFSRVAALDLRGRHAIVPWPMHTHRNRATFIVAIWRRVGRRASCNHDAPPLFLLLAVS